MRILLTILALFFATPTFIMADNVVVENIQLQMRGYDEIMLPVGTFIPVMTTEEISTETCPEGYKVKFIVSLLSNLGS